MGTDEEGGSAQEREKGETSKARTAHPHCRLWHDEMTTIGSAVAVNLARQDFQHLSKLAALPVVAQCWQLCPSWHTLLSLGSGRTPKFVSAVLFFTFSYFSTFLIFHVT